MERTETKGTETRIARVTLTAENRSDESELLTTPIQQLEKKYQVPEGAEIALDYSDLRGVSVWKPIRGAHTHYTERKPGASS